MKIITSAILASVILLSLFPHFIHTPLEASSSIETQWINAWTLTSFLQDGRVNSTFFSFPKMIWNGSHWADRIFYPSNMSGGIGSVYIKVQSTHTEIYDPTQRQERIQNEYWAVESYDSSTAEWITDYPMISKVDYITNSSGIYFVRRSILQSGSSLQTWYGLRIGSRLKISAVLDPSMQGEYRLIWKLGGVSCTRIRWTMVTENATTRRVVNDKNCSWVQFFGQNGSQSLISWFDTHSFNKTSKTWETCFQEVEVGPDTEADFVYARLIFGDFKLVKNERICVDPTIITFSAVDGIDGEIIEMGDRYPPSPYWAVSTMGPVMSIGQDVDPLFPNGWWYMIYRGYLSFDTRPVPTLAYNITAKLKLKTQNLETIDDFTVRVMGGKQEIYHENLDPEDWDCGTIEVGSWNTENYPGDNVYIELDIAPDQVNKVGRTQVELKSSNEGAEPTSPELVCFHTGDSYGNEPMLEVVYSVDRVRIGDVTWSYRNAGGDRVAMVLFGAINYTSFLLITCIDSYGGEQPTKSLYTLQFLDGLIGNGFSVLTPIHDSIHGFWNLTHYSKNSRWVMEAARWLQNNESYKQTYLFGHSGGGVAAAYEIQKDWATQLSAAAICCAPVNWDSYSSDPIYQSAHTAYKTKVATCFLEPIQDNENFYDQMRSCYNETLVHREWHDWKGGHGFFQETCAEPGHQENASEVVISWFNAQHPPSTPFTPSGRQTCYLGYDYAYSTGTFDANNDTVRYRITWDDGWSVTTWFFPSGMNISASHQWSEPGQYDIEAQACEGINGSWTPWSAPLTVTVVASQNDANTCGDAGNEFSNATSIEPGCYNGTLWPSSPTDPEDWYKLSANNDQLVYARLYSPSGANFDLELQDPMGHTRCSSTRGIDKVDSVYCIVNSTGQWRLRIHRSSGEGQYSFSLYVRTNATAMKTETDGFFYMPNITTDLIRIEKLFSSENLTGDQTGGVSPYKTIGNYPDGKVDLKDLFFISARFGKSEGDVGWNYMADIVADTKTDLKDYYAAAANYGRQSTYPPLDFTHVRVYFSNAIGTPDEYGFVSVPQGATMFQVAYENMTLVGAMIVFWER